MGRRALLFHPGVQSPQRDQRRIERVGRVGAGGQQQVGVAQQAADCLLHRRDVVGDVADLADRGAEPGNLHFDRCLELLTLRRVQSLTNQDCDPHWPKRQHSDDPFARRRDPFRLAQPMLGHDEGRDLDPRDRLAARDQLAIEEREDGHVLDAVEGLQALHIDLENSVDLGAEPGLALDRAMSNHPGTCHNPRKPAGRLILMDIARLHPHDMDLLDPSGNDDGPIGLGQDPAFEEQHPVVIVGNQ